MTQQQKLKKVNSVFNRALNAYYSERYPNRRQYRLNRLLSFMDDLRLEAECIEESIELEGV